MMQFRPSSLVTTKHARERMLDRRISIDAIANTISNPDRTEPNSDKRSIKYIRTIQGRTYHIVAAPLPKEKKQLVISVWVRGEEDSQSFVWQLITAPFKLVIFLVRWLFSREK